MNRNLETDHHQPRKDLLIRVDTSDEVKSLEMKGFLHLTCSQFQRTQEPESGRKTAHSSCSAFPPVAEPTLLVDMTSQRSNTQVGFQVQFPPDCGSKRSGSRLTSQTLFTRRHDSTGHTVHRVFISVSPHPLLVFFSGERSPIVRTDSADSCMFEAKRYDKKTFSHHFTFGQQH